MITLSNIRKEVYGETTRLVCDFEWGGGITLSGKQRCGLP